jgi:hypothetical protein
MHKGSQNAPTYDYNDGLGFYEAFGLQPPDYDLLPETSKWVCRWERASVDGKMCLKVSTAGMTHFFPTFYTSIFMLLDLQQLSSLAEAIRLPSGISLLYEEH